LFFIVLLFLFFFFHSCCISDTFSLSVIFVDFGSWTFVLLVAFAVFWFCYLTWSYVPRSSASSKIL
jgi:hypothetical protein